MAWAMRVFAMIVLGCVVVGCGGGRRDVTSMRHYWGGYRPGEVYELTEDVLLTTRGFLFALLPGVHPQPPGPWDARMPPELKLPRTIEEFEEDPGAYPMALEVVPAGTRFRIDRLVYDTVGQNHSVWVMATLLNFETEFKEVNVGRLGGGNFLDPQPSPKVMRLVSAPEEKSLRGGPR